jgi:hypothetical protein
VRVRYAPRRNHTIQINQFPTRLHSISGLWGLTSGASFADSLNSSLAGTRFYIIHIMRQSHVEAK